MARDLVKEFNEIKEKLRPNYKFRKSEKYMELPLHVATFSSLLYDADKKDIMDAIDGIAEGKFATPRWLRSVEGFVLKDIIRDNIYDAEIVSKSFNAMETMLNSTVKLLRNSDKKNAVSEVNAMQNMLYAIADLYDNYPVVLGGQTDRIYEAYKNMMKEYSIGGFNSETYHKYSEVEDYFYGNDAYKIAKEVRSMLNEENMAWEAKNRLEAAKQRVYNKFTKKEIADYEVSHTEQVIREDAQYRAELKDFVKGHENRERSKEHQKQINEIKLKHNDKLLEAAYDNFKDVARKPKEDDKSEKLASNDVPKRAAYIGRGKPRQ